MAVTWPTSQMEIALQALRSADPAATLTGAWPHMPADRCQRFVDEATPLDNVGDVALLDVATRRFLHDVNATWPVLPPETRLPLWRRLLPWLFPLSLTAGLLTAVVMTR